MGKRTHRKKKKNKSTRSQGCLEKVKNLANILPNGGLMVIYHWKGKTSPTKQIKVKDATHLYHHHHTNLAFRLASFNSNLLTSEIWQKIFHGSWGGDSLTKIWRMDAPQNGPKPCISSCLLLNMGNFWYVFIDESGAIRFIPLQQIYKTPHQFIKHH